MGAMDMSMVPNTPTKQNKTKPTSQIEATIQPTSTALRPSIQQPTASVAPPILVRGERLPQCAIRPTTPQIQSKPVARVAPLQVPTADCHRGTTLVPINSRELTSG